MDEMGGVYSTCWTEQKYIHTFWYGVTDKRVHLYVDINKCIINQFLQEYHGITSFSFLKLDIPLNICDVFISWGFLKNDSDTFI